MNALLTRHGDPIDNKTLEVGIEEALAAVRRLAVRGTAEEGSKLFRAFWRHLMRQRRYDVVVDVAQRLLATLPKGSSHEAAWLGNLGLCYREMGDLARAIDFHRRALAIGTQLGHLEGQASQLGNLGICHKCEGRFAEAIELLQQALAIDQRLGRLEGQATLLGSLGVCHRKTGAIGKALECHQQALAINEQLDRPEAQAIELVPGGD